MRREALDKRVTQLLDEAGKRDQRDFETVQPALKPEPRAPLCFPSGLAITPNHLYVADTGHHRVLECSLDGRILRQFGSGSPGFLDGTSAECSLQSPRGLVVIKDMLYVADTGNHALRRIRLLDGDTDTLAGNGRAGLPSGSMSGAASELPLNAPWDVAGGFDRIFVAMAGMHQIWEYDLAKNTLRPVAGSGRIGLVDGEGEGAAFGQPAGLALVQQTLYVADSAASAIRSVQLGNGGVQTLVGQGLYDFGDQDGTRSAARLQYPLSICLDPRSPLLWIADTYNDSLRMLRLGGGDLRRFEIDYRLHQPGAIAVSPGILWVANTSAHEVIRIDLDGGTVRRLPIGE
jgi:sugar lactone lactonase YvrE